MLTARHRLVAGWTIDLCFGLGDNSILVFSSLAEHPANNKSRAVISVGEHPNQIAVHPTDGRLFVACAGSNSVSVIDGKTDTVIETISTRLEPTRPERSTRTP